MLASPAPFFFLHTRCGDSGRSRYGWELVQISEHEKIVSTHYAVGLVCALRKSGLGSRLGVVLCEGAKQIIGDHAYLVNENKAEMLVACKQYIYVCVMQLSGRLSTYCNITACVQGRAAHCICDCILEGYEDELYPVLPAECLREEATDPEDDFAFPRARWAVDEAA